MHGGLTEIPTSVFELAILVRAGILVLCVIDWIRRREAASHGPEPPLPIADEVPEPVPS